MSPRHRRKLQPWPRVHMVKLQTSLPCQCERGVNLLTTDPPTSCCCLKHTCLQTGEVKIRIHPMITSAQQQAPAPCFAHLICCLTYLEINSRPQATPIIKAQEDRSDYLWLILLLQNGMSESLLKNRSSKTFLNRKGAM